MTSNPSTPIPDNPSIPSIPSIPSTHPSISCVLCGVPCTGAGHYTISHRGVVVDPAQASRLFSAGYRRCTVCGSGSLDRGRGKCCQQLRSVVPAGGVLGKRTALEARELAAAQAGAASATAMAMADVDPGVPPIPSPAPRRQTLPGVEPAWLAAFRTQPDMVGRVLRAPVPTIVSLPVGMAARVCRLLSAGLRAGLPDVLATLPKLLTCAPPPHRSAREWAAQGCALAEEGKFGDLLLRLEERARALSSRRGGGKGGGNAKAARLEAQRSVADALDALSVGRPGLALSRLRRGETVSGAEGRALLAPLFPAAREQLSPQGSVEPGVLAFAPSNAAIAEGVASLTLRSAPGPSGLRPELLKSLFGVDADAVCELVRQIAAGTAPSWLRDARGIALRKAGGGVRPVCVGEVLRRLAGRVIASGVTPLVPLPHQLCMRADGCGAGAAAVLAALEKGQGEHVAYVLDIANAFNTAHRDVLLAATGNTPLAPYARWAYGSPSAVLLAGEPDIASARGVHQGDPCGPLVFALLLEALLGLGAERRVFVSAFADDLVVVGGEAECARAVEDIAAVLGGAGLLLNKSKSYVWPQAACRPQGFAEAPDTLVVLGVPIAGQVGAWLRAKAQKVETDLGALAELQHPQGELSILRACGPASKVAHLLRSVPDSSWPVGVKADLDAITREHLQRIVGLDVAEGAALLASLPIRLGGLGLERVDDVAAARLAYASGQVAVARTAVACFTSGTGRVVAGALVGRVPPALPPGRDVQVIADRIFAEAAARDPARCIALAAGRDRRASAWLQAKAGGAESLDAGAMRTAVRMRLGLPVTGGAEACVACGAVADAFGAHGLSCKARWHSVIHRHDAMADVVTRCAGVFDTGVRREARAGESRNRPGDVALRFQGPGGPWSLLDITVKNPFKLPITASSLLNPGLLASAAGNAGYLKKVNKWEASVRSGGVNEGFEFTPVALSALGVFEVRGEAVLTRVAKYAAVRRGVEVNKAVENMFVALSVALWRGNAKCVGAFARSGVVQLHQGGEENG